MSWRGLEVRIVRVFVDDSSKRISSREPAILLLLLQLNCVSSFPFQREAYCCFRSQKCERVSSIPTSSSVIAVVPSSDTRWDSVYKLKVLLI